jgi:dihydrofolate reductase
LPDRINVVMTRNKTFNCEGAVVVHDIEELAETVENYSGEIYVCGGESIYSLLLPYCNKALITKIDDVSVAETWLVNLECHDEWEKVSEDSWHVSSSGVRFKYVEYKRSDRST